MEPAPKRGNYFEQPSDADNQDAPLSVASAAAAAGRLACSPLAPACENAGDEAIAKAPAPVQRARKLLAEHYVGAKDTFDAGMLPAGAAPTVENVQVNLIMLPKRSLQDEFSPDKVGFASSFDTRRVEHAFSRAGETLNAITLEEICNDVGEDGFETKGVAAVASAGCGKTFTFTKVAPRKWAMGQLWSRRMLVVARELRCKDVREATSLSKLLGLDGIGIEEPAEQQVICDYVRTHPDSLCLILDGMDETSLAECSSFVQAVVRSEKLPGIHLIITSRPCADIFSISSLPHFCKHIELVGFRRADVETYAKKVLQPEKARALIAELRDSEYLRGMMATPFIAKEVCVQFHRDNWIPQCVADVFERMIVQIAERRCSRKFQQWSHIPKDVRKLILEMGRFAFDMLLAKRLIFSEEDIQENTVSEDAVSLGLLVTCEESLSKTASRQWRFSHLTMQENMAAIYQAQHQPMTKARLVRLLECLGAESAHLRTFWVLLCAQLNTEQAESLVNELLTRRKTRQWRSEVDELDFSISDPFPFNFIVPMYDVLDAPLLYQLAEELLRERFGGQGGKDYIEAKMRMETTSTCDVAFLKTLLLAWQDIVAGASDDSLLRSLGDVSLKLQRHCHDCLVEQLMRGGEQTHLDIDNVFTSLKMLAFECFTEFVTHQRLDTCAMPSITAALRRLAMPGDMHPSDSRAVDTAIRHHPHALQELDLQGRKIPTESQFPSALAQCTGLKHLNMELSLGNDVFPIVVSAVKSSHRNLSSLTICRQRYASEHPGLFHALSTCQSLKKLDICASQLSPQSESALVAALSQLSTLTQFSIQKCGGNSLIPDICHALANCSSMATAGFFRCGLTAASLPAITAALGRWPKLETLDLGGSNFHDVSAWHAREFTDAIIVHGCLRDCDLSFDFRWAPHSYQFDRMLSPDSYVDALCEVRSDWSSAYRLGRHDHFNSD